MTWTRITTLEKDETIKFLFHGYDAVDTERQLALYTTNGRTRNARRWFITRYDMPTARLNWLYGKVTFRAWDLEEAIERLSETRIANRINKQFGKVVTQSALVVAASESGVRE